MAIELFDRGLSQMDAGDYEHGCPALRESLRLSPRAGTVFTVAECEARWGRHASALAHYDDYLSRLGRMSPPDQRKQRARELVARKQLLELKRLVPRLVVRLAEASPGSAPAPSSSRGTVAWVLAGGGALATLGGLTLGVLAIGQKGAIDEHCSGHLCDAEGTSAASRAQTLGLASTVVTSAGLAAIGAATVLWLTAPKRGTESAKLSPRPTAWAGKREGFIGLEGSFQ